MKRSRGPPRLGRLEPQEDYFPGFTDQSMIVAVPVNPQLAVMPGRQP